MIKYADFIEEKPILRTLINERGQEVLSDKPVSIPLNFSAPPSSLLELMHQLYRSMRDDGVETFEDSEDFDVPDELGIEMESTPYEQDFDHIAGDSAPSAESSAVSDKPSDESQEVKK